MKKNLKLTALVLAALLCFPVLTACGSPSAPATTAPVTTDPATTAPATTAPPAEKTFTVGFDASFPPYGYRDDSGEYVGFDLDLAAEVCARQGWTLVKKPIDWDSKDFELESGAVDCIWNGFTINGREDLYTWTVPYVDNSQVVVVTADSGITSFADLAGKVVGVQADSSALHALEGEDLADLAGTFKELMQFADYLTAFMGLESGAIEAIAMDVGVADYQIAQRGDGFVKLSENLATEQYGVGFKLGNTELRDTVEASLLEMAEDGTFAAIAETWGLTDAVTLGK